MALDKDTLIEAAKSVKDAYDTLKELQEVVKTIKELA